jgi:Na+/H+ antiporter NhaD/arsenite permease-like protein
MNRFFQFVKKELVFFISATAAIVTCFFVHPSAAYLKYIDWNTLALLFSLMTVVAGLRRCGVFVTLGNVLCSKVKSVRGLCGVLVFLCFFLSMFVTNDVSLITFVPFAITLLLSLGVQGKYIMLTVILQTVAANCGSMLTPIGNPQNLFLYGKMNCGLWNFMRILLPYTLISFVLLVLSLLVVPGTRLSVQNSACGNKNAGGKQNAPEHKLAEEGVRSADKTQLGKPCDAHHADKLTVIRTVLYALLFITSILSVLGVFPKWCAAAATFVVVLAADRTTFSDVDYMLLLTFVAFFVFTGNIQHLDVVRNLLERVVQGNECASSVIASQVISNVPAALLLYPFSKNVEGLLCGVDIGGLGTLVASLASLISFKIYSASVVRNTDDGNKVNIPSPARFLVFFTVVNCIFLAVLLVWYFLV